MIYSLRGALTHIEPSFVVIDCGGVGYKCLISMNTQISLPKLNQEASLYTHMSIREDAVELFGFSTTSELSCFRLLISISKVGPKAALAILSEFTPDQLAITVASSDSKALTRASGVGIKLAQRIILELKDKLKAFETNAESSQIIAQYETAAEADNIQKAVEALAVLGYDSSEILPILSKQNPEHRVEDLISAVLREMAAR